MAGMNPLFMVNNIHSHIVWLNWYFYMIIANIAVLFAFPFEGLKYLGQVPIRTIVCYQRFNSLAFGGWMLLKVMNIKNENNRTQEVYKKSTIMEDL
jgi:hypothetical protein